MPTVRTNQGFTLIELLVVMSLITLMLFVTIPRLPANPFMDGKSKASAWIMRKVPALRDQALEQIADRTLHIDLDNQRLWTTGESMTEVELEAASHGGYAFPEGDSLESVEFPDGERLTTGHIKILFSRHGYAQSAIITARFSDGARRSFLIEPFLHGVKLYEKDIHFDQ
jgi:prepilin-type N-terminal cleavage/methylation domain-containing protein